MTLARPMALPLTLALAFGAAPAAPAQTASELLYEAFYLEDGVRRIEEASDKYRAAAALAAESDDARTETKARLGLARCLDALGAFEAAAAELERVLVLDPENAEARAALERRDRQGGLDPELRLKIQALVQKLGGPEREQAGKDLKRIGDLAVPFLADGLRSREVAVVENAAVLLADNGKAPALDALEEAFADEEVLFPHLLVDALRQEVPDVEHSVWERVIERPIGDGRFRALQQSTMNEGGRAALAPRFEELLRDPDVRVRRETLDDLREPALSALLDAVIARLDSGDTDERGEAVFALGRVEHAVPAAAAALVGRLEDEVVDVRRKALRAIEGHWKKGRVDADVAYRAVVRLLDDEDLRLVEDGVEFLRELSGPWPAEVRAAVMGSIDRVASSPETSREARWLLEGLPELTDAELTTLFHRALDPAWKLDEDDRNRARAAAASRVARRQPSDAARAAWIAETFAATDDAAGQRILLDMAYGLSDEPHAEVMLLGAASPHPVVRVEAYEQLAKRGSRGGAIPAFVFERLPHLPEDLASEYTGVARNAFELVQPHPRPEWEDAAAAWQARRPSDPDTLRFLLDCAGDRAVDRARAALGSSNRNVRHTAVRELIDRAGAAEAGRIVASAAAERSDPLELISGYNRKSGRIVGPPDAFVRAFVAALPDEKIGPDVIAYTYAALDRDPLERVVALGLASDAPEMRRAACTAVAGTVYEPALARVTPLLDSPHLEVREAAAAAVDAIRERIERRTQAELLGPEGKAASIDRARKLLADDDPVKRRGGALALGALGDPSVVPLLLDLLDDEDEEVRAAALKALEALGEGARG